MNRIRRGSRPLVAHMLGFLLGVFPAQFFLYAALAMFPPVGLVEPVSGENAFVMLCIFVVSLLILHRITKDKDSSQSCC